MTREQRKAIAAAVRFAEEHLAENPDLDTIAEAVHYSKYHLHRLFFDAVGITVHDYVRRRRLTEAARLLVFTEHSILQAALEAGYESQQAFTGIFKAMYKMTPAEYRRREMFYPLQLEFVPECQPKMEIYGTQDVVMASASDIPDWMMLVRLVIDGYPCLQEESYVGQLLEAAEQGHAMLIRSKTVSGPEGAKGKMIGAMIFSADTGRIEFLAVHPQYRRMGIAEVFLEKLTKEVVCGREISITTFRQNDKADTGYRLQLKQLGFAESELLVEFGYPTQRFVLLPGQKEEQMHGEKWKAHGR